MNQKTYTKKELFKFLSNFPRSADQEITHTSMFGSPSPGSFCIPDSKLAEFYDIYSGAVFNNDSRFEPIISIVERHSAAGPFVVDFDFNYAKNTTFPDNQKRCYTLQWIQAIISVYYNHLSQYLVLDTPEKRLALVFEKPRAVEKNSEQMKDGVHLMFPYLVTTPEFQFFIRDKILAEYDSIPARPVATNNWDDIVDKSVIQSNGWLLYGSCKPKYEKNRYKFTHLFSYNDGQSQELPMQTIDATPERLVSLCSVRGKSENITFKSEIAPDWEQYRQQQFVTIKKRRSPKKPEFLNKTGPIQQSFSSNELPTTEEAKMAVELTKILNPKRADQYQTWIEVGWCLHNIHPQLLPCWVQFSKQAAQYSQGAESECRQRWHQMKDEGLGIRTLQWWARQDNLEGYTKLYRHNLCKLICDCLDKTPYSVAKVVYELYQHTYACSSIKRRTWWEFKNHRWQEIDCGITLRSKICNEVSSQISREASRQNLLSCHDETNEMNETLSSGEKQKAQDRANALAELPIRLRNTTFKDNIMTECRELFYQKKFEEQLDHNIYLLGFENGIFDLKKNQFRNGRPEDMVSYSTRICYQQIDPNDITMWEVKQFLAQVLPEDKLRRYTIRLLASFMNGSTSDEKFHIWTGCGGNGKSKLIDLFQMVLGDYSTTCPVTMITQKRGLCNGCTPELAKTKGKRFITFQEPDNNEHIQVGLMKELTGGDTITARHLHKDPIEFKPQFKPVLTCNELPRIPSDDQGTWRRLRVVPFESEFVDNPDPNNEHQFKRDYHLNEKLPNWSIAFLNILMEEYRIYQNGDPEKGISPGLQEPSQVMEHTDRYQADNDFYSQFVNYNLEKCDLKEVLKLDEAFMVFRQWYKDSYNVSQSKTPDKNSLRQNLDKKLGKSVIQKGRKQGWRGWRFIPEDFGEEEDGGQQSASEMF